MRQTKERTLFRWVFLTAILPTLLTMMPGAFGQHLTGARRDGFNGGGFHGGFFAPSSFRRFSGQVPHGFGVVPRMNWTAPR